MKKISALTLSFFFASSAFCAVPKLEFTNEVAYSQPSFYLLMITTLVLLGAILLFLGAMVALTRAGYYKNIGNKAQSVLRKGFFAIAGLIGLLFAALFLADQNLVDLLFLRDNAFVALSVVVLLELWVLAYAYAQIRLATSSSGQLSQENA
jgi:hypothetical protein